MGMTNTNQDYAGECDPSNCGTQEEVNPNVIHQDDTEDLEQVKEISIFATQIYNWHVDLMNQCRHVVNMPIPQEGDTAYIRINVTAPEGHPDRDPETGKRALKLEEYPAFIAGVRYAADMLAELPFKFLPTDADGNVQPEYASSGSNEQE